MFLVINLACILCSEWTRFPEYATKLSRFFNDSLPICFSKLVSRQPEVVSLYAPFWCRELGHVRHELPSRPLFQGFLNLRQQEVNKNIRQIGKEGYNTYSNSSQCQCNVWRSVCWSCWSWKMVNDFQMVCKRVKDAFMLKSAFKCLQCAWVMRSQMNGETTNIVFIHFMSWAVPIHVGKYMILHHDGLSLFIRFNFCRRHGPFNVCLNISWTSELGMGFKKKLHRTLCTDSKSTAIII